MSYFKGKSIVFSGWLAAFDGGLRDMLATAPQPQTTLHFKLWATWRQAAVAEKPILSNVKVHSVSG